MRCLRRSMGAAERRKLASPTNLSHGRWGTLWAPNAGTFVSFSLYQRVLSRSNNQFRVCSYFVKMIIENYTYKHTYVYTELNICIPRCKRRGGGGGGGGFRGRRSRRGEIGQGGMCRGGSQNWKMLLGMVPSKRRDCGVCRDHFLIPPSAIAASSLTFSSLLSIQFYLTFFCNLNYYSVGICSLQFSLA